jgi:hypothetical protein
MTRRIVVGAWCLVLALTPGYASAQLTTEDCKGRKIIINGANAGGVDFVIGANPVLVLNQNDTRCKVTLRNKGATPMRCMPVQQGTPSATAGLEFVADKQLTLDTSSRPAWMCVRTTGTSTAAETIEELP